MKKMILTAVLSLVATSALANPVLNNRNGAGRCLQRATNAELVNEIQNRLRYSPVTPIQQDEFVTTISCDTYTLHVSSTNTSSGEAELQRFSLGSASQCSTTLQLLDAALKSNSLKNKVVASCDTYTLSKFIVSADKKIKKLANENYGSSSECQTVASQINSAN